MKDERLLEISLAIMRLSLVLFFLVWSIGKLIVPELTQKIFATFYFSEISPTVSVGLGGIQTVIVLIFLTGKFKTLSYGAVLGMHTVSLLSTYQQLLNPYQPLTFYFGQEYQSWEPRSPYFYCESAIACLP